jgi:predicted enzyme related to lactoylglutathione lyase
MEKSSNSINWFEIPATDIERAKKFYETIFNIKMEPLQEMMGMKMVGFPWEAGSGKANGALVQSDMHTPSMHGVIIYLNANPSLQDVIDRIDAAGGEVLMPKTQISAEIGYMGFFKDSEGNKLALHETAKL